MAESRIVSAVAAFTGHGDLAQEELSRNERIQNAMIGAAADAQANRITDNAVIRDLMLKARDKVLSGTK